MSASEPQPGALRRDLYCLTCGYNLRGLGGDPVRCPECGGLNPIGDIEPPAALIREALRRMETAPVVFATALLMGVPLAVLAWMMWGALFAVGVVDACNTVLTFSISFGVLGGLTWGAARFRELCDGQPGWIWALVNYQLWALLLVAGTFVVVPVGVVGGAALLMRGKSPGLTAALALLALALVVFAIARIVPRCYARAIAPLAPLQREAAVRIARDTSRKRMQHGRRGTGC